MTMSREEPLFRKCCFCIPLKLTLQTWACIKMIVDIAALIFLGILSLILFVGFSHWLSVKEILSFSLIFIPIVMLSVDTGFMIYLFVGLCQKNIKNLRVFYNYSLYMVTIGSILVLGAIGVTIFTFVGKSSSYKIALIFVAVIVINTLLDVCIILTLKSEMIKLRNKQQFEFVKIPDLHDEDSETTEPPEALHKDEENLDV